jgi:hypothetical protein
VDPPAPPPEIISAATTTSQVMPMPTSIPTSADGSTPGRMMRRKMLDLEAPIERATWTKRRSMVSAPPITLMTMV